MEEVNLRAVAVTACVTASTLGVLLWKTRLQNYLASPQKIVPEKWVQVASVSKLFVYPIKSCRGILVPEGVITELGLKHKDYNVRDRDFMLIDENGVCISQIKAPKMALIEVSAGGHNEITLNAPDMSPVTFGYPKEGKVLPNREGLPRICKLKHDKGVKALDCGDEVAHWLARYLDFPGVRVVYHHINKTQRTFEPYMYKCPEFAQSDMGAFHNETSYMMVSQESIDDLNLRLDKKSSWRNWRPTVLIHGVQEPFAEVNWSYTRIGTDQAILKTAVPCYRCPITTIDPEKGILPKDGEPLKTLRKMNKAEMFADKKVAEVLDKKGIMGLRQGLYHVSGEGSVIKVGDPVFAALL